MLCAFNKKQKEALKASIDNFLVDHSFSMKLYCSFIAAFTKEAVALTSGQHFQQLNLKASLK
jgi:hypothetical protein